MTGVAIQSLRYYNTCMNTKRCSKCGKTKSLDAFHLNRSRKDGRNNHCAKCATINARAWRKKHPGQSRATSKRWQATHAQRHKELSLRSRLRRDYGITPEYYAQLAIEQAHVCAICHEPEPQMARGRRKRLSVDHNHTTGKVRQLLCSNCNHMLGSAKERVDILQAAIAYLQQHAS